MKILFLLFFSIAILSSKELQKVSVQLQWLDQFQFAGYYMAKEKGFYEDFGLDVEIKKYDFGIMPVDEVVEGRATFGVGRTALAVDKSNGKDVVVISAIFQTSPLVLLGLKSSGIEKLNDMVEKRVMVTNDAGSSASINAMLKAYGVKENTLKIIPHSFDLEDLVDGKTDLMASYISNEPYILKQRGIEFITFNPKDYGFDFYSDFLFTSGDTLHNDPKMVEKFRKATLKGWEYAFENIAQSVNIIYKKYNSQNKTKDMLTYEARELKKLAYFGTQNLGDISKEKIRRTIDIFRVLGLIKSEIELSDFIYSPMNQLTKEQKKYLEKKDKIKVCINPFGKPIEYLENGNHKGMTADFFREFSKIINKEISLVETKSWKESLSFIKDRKCDILSAAAKSKDREEYLDFTTTYLSFPNLIVTHLDTPYIYDLKLLKNKKVGMIKGYSYVKDLKEQYPNIQIIEFDNLEKGLKALDEKQIYVFIDIAATIGEQIKEKNYIHLKISGQLKDSLDLRIATRNDEPILNEVFQQSIDSLDKNIENKIFNKWQTIHIEEKLNTSFLWKISLFFVLLFIVFLFGFQRLKRSKELAEQSLVNIQRMLDATIEGVCVTDEKLRIVVINESALDIFGYTKDEFLKLSLTDTVSPDCFDKAKQSIAKPISKDFEIKMIKKDRTTFPGLVSGKDIIYKGKKARISTVIDLSNLKKAQDELQKLNEELEKRVDEEVDKNIKKEQLLFQQSRQAQMGEMLSMIAHQWRQPLSNLSLSIIAIKLKIDLKKFDFETTEGRSDFVAYLSTQFEDMINIIKNLSNIIDDFRLFYKPNKKSENVDINELLDKSLNIIDMIFLQDNIEVVKNFSCDCLIEVYPNELMQVVLNILKNSQDNFNIRDIENKRITIRTYCSIGSVIIEIEDNGGGIEDKILANIFDPYFSTKDEKNGTGLGLHMSKVIIEDHHNGKLYAKNTNEGVKFIIELKR